MPTHTRLERRNRVERVPGPGYPPPTSHRQILRIFPTCPPESQERPSRPHRYPGLMLFISGRHQVHTHHMIDETIPLGRPPPFPLLPNPSIPTHKPHRKTIHDRHYRPHETTDRILPPTWMEKHCCYSDAATSGLPDAISSGTTSRRIFSRNPC